MCKKNEEIFISNRKRYVCKCKNTFMHFYKSSQEKVSDFSLNAVKRHTTKTESINFMFASYLHSLTPIEITMTRLNFGLVELSFSLRHLPVNECDHINGPTQSTNKTGEIAFHTCFDEKPQHKTNIIYTPACKFYGFCGYIIGWIYALIT